MTDEHRITELDSGVRVVTERDALRALGGARASGSAPARRRDATSRPGSRTCSSTCCSAAPTRYGSQEIDQIFDAMGAELNAGTDKETTSVYTRVLDRTSSARST